MLATDVAPIIGVDDGPGQRQTLLRPISCGLVVAYVVLLFEPFVNLYRFPGAVSSALLPVGCVGVLVLTPLPRLGRVVVSWVLAALVFWTALSWFWSVNPAVTAFEVRAQLVPLVLISLVVGAMAPGLVVRTLRLTVVTIALWTAISCIILPSARAYVPGIEAAADQATQLGLRGTFGHKNQMGAFMVLGLALVVPTQQGRWRWYLVGLMVALVIGTRSATAASGLFALVFVGFWVAAIGNQRSERERTILVLMSVLSVVTAVLLVVGLLPALLGLYQKDVTFSGRTIIWGAAVDAWAQRPLQGYGFGAVWSDGRSPVTADLWSRIGFPAAHAHDGLLELGLQVGLIGVGFFVAFALGLIGRALRAIGDERTAPVGAWGLLTMAAVLMMSVSEPLFGGPYLGLLAIIWVVLASYQRSGSRHPSAA